MISEIEWVESIASRLEVNGELEKTGGQSLRIAAGVRLPYTHGVVLHREEDPSRDEHETELLLYDQIDELWWTPRVVLECKLSKVTPHDAFSYSATASPTISDPARTPNDPKGIKYEHLLALGYEDENLIPLARGNDKARKFFEERSIPWWKDTHRSGDTADKKTPTRNMASSQIACVNFLMPLAEEPEALEAMIRCIDGDIDGIELIEDTSDGSSLKSFVEFEWVGKKTSLEQKPPTRGANATSADALVIGRTDSGNKRAYLIEWKYTEEYKKDKPLDGNNETRRERYSMMFEESDSPFIKSSLSLDDWFVDPLYQIMRFLLLSRKMIRENEFEVTEARVVVACPRGNIAYRNTVTSRNMRESFPGSDMHTVVREQLADPDLFKVVAVEDLYSAISLSSQSRTIAEWSSYQQERYGWGR